MGQDHGPVEEAVTEETSAQRRKRLREEMGGPEHPGRELNLTEAPQAWRRALERYRVSQDEPKKP